MLLVAPLPVGPFPCGETEALAALRPGGSGDPQAGQASGVAQALPAGGLELSPRKQLCRSPWGPEAVTLSKLQWCWAFL